MPLYTERCPKCGERNMTFWEYLAFDKCSVCRNGVDLSRFGIDMVN